MPDTQPTAFQIAEQWYFDLLQAELANSASAESGVYLHHFLRVLPEGGTDRGAASGPASLSLEQRLTEFEVRLNSQTGEILSWFADFLATDGDTSMPAEEALALATRLAALPEGAQLEYAGYETMADRTFFRARWIHRYEGLEVEDDYIEVLVNGAARSAFSVSRIWRQPNLTSTPMVR
jgi:hypothetical protein